MRALLSIVMLIGFLVVALLQLAGAVALAVWLASVGGGLAATKLTAPLFIAIIGGVGVALWRAIRAKNEPIPGLVLTQDQSPQLWAEVRRLADAVGTRAPDEIRLIGDVNAAVSENARLFGLIPGRRYMYLGMPLLSVLSVDQLRAVLAHELGHYSGSHTRLGAVAYRGRLAVGGTLERIGPWNPVGWVFKAYARLYLLTDNAVSRRQEYEADASAVRVAGKQAAISALTEVHIAAAAYGFYLEEFVGEGAQLGFFPDDVFGGFGQMLTAREDELARLRAEPPTREARSAWDTHPVLADRIAAINALPEGAVSRDWRRASDLLLDLNSMGRRLQAEAFNVSGRQVLPWDVFNSQASTAQLQASADRIFREIGRRIGQRDVDLPVVLGLIETGRAGEIGEAFFPDATRKEAAALFAEPLSVLLALAAIRSEHARWQHSWTGGMELVDQAGDPLRLKEIADLAVVPATLQQAQERLRELRIDVTSASVKEKTATATGSDIIAGLANVKLNNVESDLIALDLGLVAIKQKGGKDDGRKRLLTLANTFTGDQLAKQHQFLPYEEIKSVTVAKEIPVRATLHLHGGQTVEVHESWSGEDLHKHSRDVLHQVFARINEE